MCCQVRGCIPAAFFFLWSCNVKISCPCNVSQKWQIEQIRHFDCFVLDKSIKEEILQKSSSSAEKFYLFRKDL